jgi:hypothetical protein
MIAKEKLFLLLLLVDNILQLSPCMKINYFESTRACLLFAARRL